MVPQTRRHLLHVAAAVACGSAGCSYFGGEAVESSQSSSETIGSNVSNDNSETDPPTLLLRSDSETLPLVLSEDADEPEFSQLTRPSGRVTNSVIDTRERGEQLTVADDEDAEGVSAFVDETDFDAETLILNTNLVDECFRLHLCQISWESDTVRTEYVRQLRPYDERCAVDDRVFESRLIRIPVALDESSINSYASSTSGSGRCDSAGRVRAQGATRGDEPANSSNRTATGSGE